MEMGSGGPALYTAPRGALYERTAGMSSDSISAAEDACSEVILTKLQLSA